jgi:outer membrane immunogenic protein
MYSDCVSKLRIGRRKTFRARLQGMVLATAALGLLGGSALAADLPTRKGPPLAPVYIPPAFTWTGFYVGANAGYGWHNNNNNNNNGLFPFLGAVPVGAFTPFGGSSSNNGGFLAGIQGGYNYQFGIGQGFVVGAEADIDYASLGRNNNNSLLFSSFTVPQFPGTVFSPSGLASSTSKNNNQYIGTVRLRAGYAFDRFLIYATGGLAYGGVNNNGNGFGGALVATTAPGFVIPASGGAIAAVPTQTVIGGATTRSSSTKAGWTLGAGLEYAITNNWTVKAEYLYENFGNVRSAPGFVLPGVAAAFNNSNRTLNLNVVRLGVNYKFW